MDAGREYQVTRCMVESTSDGWRSERDVKCVRSRRGHGGRQMKTAV
jgi:hypothetical protein